MYYKRKRRMIFVTGDTHGNFTQIKQFTKERETIKDDVMIILGDSGLNYYMNGRDHGTKKKVQNLNITFFIIRGNHEERPENLYSEDTWHEELFFGNKVLVENEFPNIKYALDGYDYYITDIIDEDDSIFYTYHVLVVGGAYSVDKYYRLVQGWSWFPSEQLTKEEQEKILDYADWLNEHAPINCVFSHTCPIAWEPTDLFFSSIDQSTVDKSMEMFLGELEYKLDYDAWMFGHYHGDRYLYNPDGKKCLMLYNQIVDFEDFMLQDKETFLTSALSE